MRAPQADYCMLMLNGRHRNLSVKNFQKEDYKKQASTPLCIDYSHSVDGKNISLGPAIGLSKIVKTSTKIVRRKATFINAVQSLLSYMKAFVKKNGVRFVDVVLLDIIKKSLDTLAANTIAKNIRYSGDKNNIMEKQGTLTHLA